MNRRAPVLRRAVAVRGSCSKCGARNQGVLNPDTSTNGWVHSCFQCGNVSYFDQDGNPDPQVDALEGLQRQTRPHMDRRSSHELTARQKKIMRLAMVGSSNAEIGAYLGLSAGNVRVQIQGIGKKLGIPDRHILINFVRSEGLAEVAS